MLAPAEWIHGLDQCVAMLQNVRALVQLRKSTARQMEPLYLDRVDVCSKAIAQAAKADNSTVMKEAQALQEQGRKVVALARATQELALDWLTKLDSAIGSLIEIEIESDNASGGPPETEPRPRTPPRTPPKKTKKKASPKAKKAP